VAASSVEQLAPIGQGSLLNYFHWTLTPTWLSFLEADTINEHKPTGLNVKFCTLSHTATTASIDECAATGIPRWDPSTLNCGLPADDSATWGTLGAPPVDYH
jgi:hypothetical protein